MEIVRFSVNDDRFADYLPHVKPPGEHFHVCFSVIGQQRRQVPRMVRMLGPPGIEVAAGIGKAVPLTACSIVDVKGKEPRFRPGKTCHLRFNNHTIFPLKKTHHSAHRWMAAVPANLGDSNGINISLQTITPDSSYAADPSIESIDKKHNESLCPDTPCSDTRTTCAKKFGTRARLWFHF